MTNIRVAYLLTVHTCPEQLNVFIKQLLNYGDCDIYIHVDRKSEEIVKDIINNPNVFVYSKYDVRWGSFEIVKSALLLMNKAITSGKHYSHFYYGSGQDLMVKKGFYEYLQKNNDKVFIRINREITDKDRASARYRIKWPHKLMIRDDWHVYRFVRIFLQYLCTIGINPFPNKKMLKTPMHFYDGRTWFIAPIELAEYIVNYVKNHPDYYHFWKDSLASDLMFFQTIIMNSPYKEYVEDELMYVNFGKTFGTMNHPISISREDDNNIERGNYFFARKFEFSDMNSIKYYVNKVAKENRVNTVK